MDEKRIQELSKRPFAKLFPKAITDIKQRKCPVCGKDIAEFRDNLSWKEYSMSGMCQDCQDKTFYPSEYIAKKEKTK